MSDLETGTQWSHILGQAMKGKLAGTELESIPSEITAWKAWKERYPTTTVLALSRSSKNYNLEFHDQLQKFVLGVIYQGQAVAYPFPLLQSREVVNDTFFGQPWVVTFSRKATGVHLFERRVNGRVLTFGAIRGERMRDRETKSTWDAATGKCIAGKLKGTQLTEVAGIVSYKSAWRRFHPDSRVFQ